MATVLQMYTIFEFQKWWKKEKDDFKFNYKEARGGVVVKALRYKPAGRGFDSRWCHWNFSVT